MLGGHLDSWHAATGATDNGIGCAVMMEAARILYGTYTWHTNLDTYERIVEEDVKKSATVIAAAVYHLATRDEPLPRFTKDQMPPRPGSGRPQTTTPTGRH